MNPWLVMHSDKYGSELLFIEARTEKSALNKALKKCKDFDPDRECLEVLDMPSELKERLKEREQLSKKLDLLIKQF